MDKLIQLEQKLKEVKKERSDLEKQIRQQERCNKDQGKALDKMTNGVDYQIKIKNLVEELRIWKEKVKKLEMDSMREEETRKEQLSRIKKIESENQKFNSQLESIRMKKRQLEDNDSMQEINAEKIASENDSKKQEFLQEERR